MRIDCSSLKDNHYYSWKFRPIAITTSNSFYLIIKRVKSETIRPLTVWCTNGENKPNFAQKLIIDQNGPISTKHLTGPLVMRGGFEPGPDMVRAILADPFYLPLLTISIVLLGILIVASLWFSKRKSVVLAGFGQTLVSSVVALSVIVCYAYVFSEWIFFFTKPSFLNGSPASSSIQILLITPLFLLPISLISVFPILLWSLIKKQPALSPVAGVTALIAPALILSVTMFMMLDNFTYTLWGFHAGTFKSWGRLVYLIIFVSILAGCWSYLFRKSLTFATGFRNLPIGAASGLLIISLVGAVVFHDGTAGGFFRSGPNKASKFPNILIITPDGLNAEHMSVYGYHRKTTPFLDKLSKSSLVAENFLPNSNFTIGGLGAIYTGKLPIRTRMINYPNVFRGVHAHQHFVGFLRQLGYTTGVISLRRYLDPYERGLRGAFSSSNGWRPEENLPKFYSVLVKRYYPAAKLFEFMGSRSYDIITHIFMIRDYFNTYEHLTEESKYSDQERIDEAIAFMSEAKTPFFLHLHLMTTHGPGFDKQGLRYSVGKRQTRDYQTDFYDDAILRIDRIIARLSDSMKSIGKRNNTIIVVTSDHGMGSSPHDRIPLIINAPGEIHKERIVANGQLADIGPTLLDILGVEPPAWLDGESLISHQNDSIDRPIFFAVAGDENPMFGALGKIGVVLSDNWYALDVHTGVMESGKIKGHTHPSDSKPLTEDEIRRIFVQRLKKDGYELSSLPTDHPLRVTE